MKHKNYRDSPDDFILHGGRPITLIQRIGLLIMAVFFFVPAAFMTFISIRIYPEINIIDLGAALIFLTFSVLIFRNAIISPPRK